ncbi:MAG: pyridoxal phosphate-dependent aminotransferase [Thermoleophilaceae bacterium]
MSVLTWPGAGPAIATRASARAQALESSHHAMWNYMTYRDAIELVGLESADLYPEGTTRLDPAEWADLGWLASFCGPPQSALDAMRDSVSVETVNQYTPDLIDPLREAAAAAIGLRRDGGLEVMGVEGAQAGVTLALLAGVDPGDEVILGDPGYFHLPGAVIVAGATPVVVPIGAHTGHLLDPDAVAGAITPRTRAICVVDPLNPFGTVHSAEELSALAELAERHDLMLIHDVTHAPIAIDERVPHHMFASLGAGERALTMYSVSHCWGMAGARIGFMAGPPGLIRRCLRLKAAVTRLNTSLVAQYGALAALRDPDHLSYAGAVVRRNLAHLEETLGSRPGLELVTRPARGLACAVDVSGTEATAQELVVALFARRVVVYPGDGLGAVGAASTLRMNLSRPDPWAMEHLREVLDEAVEEAASGRWAEPVAALLEGKGTARAHEIAELIRAR